MALQFDPQAYKYRPAGNRFCLVDEAAQALTGKAKQNFKLIVIGATGTGKSEFMLYMAWALARELSRRKYKGDPDHWQEFFPYWQNIAVISEADMLRVLQLEVRGQIKTYDEIQEKASNARDFRSNMNRLFNQEFILKRPDRNAIICDAQWIAMLDRQSRYQYHWVAEMLPVHDFDLGMATCKLKKMELRALDESDPAHFMYPYQYGVQYQVFPSLLAPKEIRDYYAKHRVEQSKVAADERIEEERKKRVMDDVRYERATKAKSADRIADYLQQHPDAKASEVSDALGINITTVRTSPAWRHRKA